MRAEDSIDIESQNSKFKPLIENNSVIDIEDSEIDHVNHKILDTYKISKTIQIYSGIDTMVNGFYVFFNPWYIIPTFISSLGYFGALNYNMIMLCIYFVYQLIMIFVRIGLNVDSYIHNRFEIGPLIVMVFMTVILTLFDLYILRFIFKIIKNIKLFSQDDITKLKNMKEIKTRFIYW